MNPTSVLLAEIAATRMRLLARVEDLSPDEVIRPPTGGGWSVAEIVEHLVRAEDYGILGLWSSFPDPESEGIPLDAALASRSIDEIFRETPARVDAPPAVEPRAGGRPVAYWVARLRSHDAVIAELAEAMEGVGFSQVVYPHHIVGPLDGAQRLQFFRWHLERHLAQIERTVVPTAAT